VTVVHEGNGYRIERSEGYGAPVPYGPEDHPDGDRNHGFIDLRDRPDLVAQIPEAQKSEGLAEFLRAINEPGSPLMSIGCECGLFKVESPQEGGPTEYVGGYIDLTFRDPFRNRDAEALVDLAVKIWRRVQMTNEHHAQYAFIVERLVDFFGMPGRYSLMVKPVGYGRSPEQAWRAFSYAASALGAAVRGLPRKARRGP
jgi:hypothetical protein